MSRFGLKTCGATAALLVASSSAQAGEPFYRNGQLCQRASSGYVVCRDPDDYWSEGYVVSRGRRSGGRSGRVFYRDGYKCQRADSGHVVCRDPRDRWSPGFVVR